MHISFQPDLSQDEITLSEEESKHCIRVLRMKSGDDLFLTDGKGMQCTGKITSEHPKHATIKIISRDQQERTRPYHLHIAISPTKNMERIEWFVEKATECGIDEISFIETSHTERVKVNMERVMKVAISAMKQSRQWYLPDIHPINSLSDFIKDLPPLQKNESRFIAWCENDKTISLNKILNTSPTENIMILIGPEGDFNAHEISLGQHHHFQPVSLGNSILRTETAGLYACMAVKAICE